METGTSGFLSISDSDLRVPAVLGQESQAWSCVEEWNSACLSRCSRGDRPLVELNVEPTVVAGRCTGVSVPLRVVPSSTGLPSKRCQGIGFLTRSDREIGFFWHLAPPTRLCLEFPRQTGLILRCVRKVGNYSRQSRGIDPPVAIRKGEGAQMKWSRENRCSPRVRPWCRGTVGVASRVPSTVSHFKMEGETSLETL